jgi:tRNA-Thr(GGU) m(6)t(6)A37 methyltransferase TsaA
MKSIKIKPIGVVRNKAGRRRHDEWGDVISEIVIDPEYTEALYRIDEFSHIYVLYYAHKVEERFVMKIHPTRNPLYPLVGAFATRTQNRPNPIALTICELISKRENVLVIKGLDALDSSPVIDIKPYSPRYGVDGVRLPDWMTKLMKKTK